jgi:(2Fe-2S) ferredoxin
VGTITNFTAKKKGKVKRFELETPQGKFWFKIPHKLHKKINCRLYPYVSLEARGRVKVCPKKAKFKLKLKHIKILSNDPDPLPFNLSFLSLTSGYDIAPEYNMAFEKSDSAESKGKILLCKKSPCWKRGGKLIYEEIVDELKDKGLEDHVSVKKTGCMGHCKSAPNLVVLPDNIRYKRFKQKNINSLIETHFPSNAED